MGRKLTALVLVALIALAHPALVIAQGGCSVGPTWLTGDSFTASALNENAIVCFSLPSRSTPNWKVVSCRGS